MIPFLSLAPYANLGLPRKVQALRPHSEALGSRNWGILEKTPNMKVTERDVTRFEP